MPDTLIRPTPTEPVGPDLPWGAPEPVPPSAARPDEPPPPDGTTTAAVPPRRRRRLAAAGVALALALGSGASGALVAERLAGDGTAVRVTPATNAVASVDSLSGVVASVSPSIVTVQVTDGGSATLGSGVVLDRDGLILTNAHVVSSGGQVTVELSDGRTAAATVVGRDSREDIALLRASGLSGLTPATLGSDATLRVGDQVLAFGSPLGLQGTVTSGIVSALDRTVDEMSGLVQTDAAINHGNSGGALVDTAGRVVGINVAIATSGQDSGSIGLGFALPIDTVRTVVTRLEG
ncbi:trypsin-like peptidase domain-containing protein [Micromonospora sp. PLK6-60]|uniref:S1C family serine protease n=1 Tax=Micromonospora sp. PLK6-60 TaxID=2873383 RepID=UPI001CA66A23|nr:trypsin-like peptidase domain-containing protein [Micromonospora sp. PLK6-60]MBY8872289.1 trypsin-like peptidase domain-containing protein [Micromonospora sp. PLK6-60]